MMHGDDKKRSSSSIFSILAAAALSFASAGSRHGQFFSSGQVEEEGQKVKKEIIRKGKFIWFALL
jgi:hypothetical protein